jgi:hypothetical protein
MCSTRRSSAIEASTRAAIALLFAAPAAWVGYMLTLGLAQRGAAVDGRIAPRDVVRE